MADEAVERPARGRKVRPIRIDGELAYVPLTRGLFAVVDAKDASVVEGSNWYALVTRTGHTYAVRATYCGGKQRVLLMHREILGAAPGMDVDHRDGDGLNNRRQNLRECTHRQNMANTLVTRRNKLGLKGVYAAKGKFSACIEVDRQTRHLGTYATKEEAAAAYAGAARALHGSFAVRAKN